MREAELLPFFVSLDTTIQDVLARIDSNRQGIALVADNDRKLIGTVTDGDLRRAILSKINLSAPVSNLLARKNGKAVPLTARVGTSKAELLRLMNDRGLRHIPLLNLKGQVVDIALLTELAKEQETNLRGVIMAGGYGTRLMPLTEAVPKPMLPIGGRPILEHIVEQFRAAGIRSVNFAIHYKGKIIQDYFGDGSRFGISVGYTEEDQPLGTAGALRSLKDFDEPILVINGDILSKIDFNAFFNFHKEQNAQMTVAVRIHEVSVPYGLIETDGVAITGLVEKPVIRHFVNAGIYLLNPEVRAYIPRDRRFDMTDLIERLVQQKCAVVSFPILDYWMDLGRHADYEQAQEDVRTGENTLTVRTLVTGGAGYLGSTLVAQLLSTGHQVRVLDVLAHGGSSLQGSWSDPNFEFLRGDIRDEHITSRALAGVDAIVHLAAIVGDPACARNPDEARSINLDASLALIEKSKAAGVQRLIFASTCSNYGKMTDSKAYVDESSELRPVSLYAETKVAVEKAILDPAKTGSLATTALRFATLYGVAPRMRFDLTVNEFTMEMLTKKRLVVYGEQFWRPYVHVRDAARAIQMVLEQPGEKMRNAVFNVGSTDENFRKLDLVELIKPYAQDAVVEYVKKTEDPRDYRVSFSNIQNVLGFELTRNVKDGIREIAGLIQDKVLQDFDNPHYRN